jgi:hypothetical protein
MKGQILRQKISADYQAVMVLEKFGILKKSVLVLVFWNLIPSSRLNDMLLCFCSGNFFMDFEIQFIRQLLNALRKQQKDYYK